MSRWKSKKFYIVLVSTICSICFVSILFSILWFRREKYISVELNDNTIVRLFDYKSISVKKEEIPVLDDDDISSIISFDLSSNDRFIQITDRTSVADDDIILIDIFNEAGELIESNRYYRDGEIPFLDNSISVLYNSKVGDTINASIQSANNAIKVKIIIKGIYRDADVHNDIGYILSCYNCKSYDEVCNYIRNKSYNDWAFDYMWNIIFQKSRIVKYSDQIQLEITEKYNNTKDKLLEDESSYNHLHQNNEESEDELYEYYNTFLIGDAILREEGIKITDSDVRKELFRLQAQENITAKDLEKQYGRDFFYYCAQSNKLKEVLVPMLIIKK